MTAWMREVELEQTQEQMPRVALGLIVVNDRKNGLPYARFPVTGGWDPSCYRLEGQIDGCLITLGYSTNLERDVYATYNHVETLKLGADDLNVFKDKQMAHRVTPSVGDLERVVAVFTYYETPGRMFGDEENMGFYGRTNTQRLAT